MGLIPIHPRDEVNGWEDYRCVEEGGEEGEPDGALVAVEGDDGSGFTE